MNYSRSDRRNILLPLLLLFITMISFSTPFIVLAAQTQATQTQAPLPKAPDQKELIYALQHEIIPGILFSDKGTLFFNDLFSGNTGPFLQIIEEPLGYTYASGIKISPEHIDDTDLVLISFPVPADEPQVFHVFLVRKSGTFRYLALEKGNDVGNIGTKSFFCEWSADHNHKNYGSRKYEEATAFRKELLDFLKK
ncbi:MAG: hypothetical protein FDX30_10630 [Chlorobium sp.]|nr:MAG: hypothetical protein FDX30_10630 [Chlorobium sp.]